MLNWLRGMAQKKSQKNLKKVRTVRPMLEQLDHRLVPTVTYGGGNLLPHVETQGLYVGDQWSANSTLFNQTGYLEGFLGNLVNSPYMDALANAGYGVGRGSSSGGKISLASLPAGSTLTDGTMRSWLNSYISDHTLQPVDANRLYVLFVEPNVIVKANDGSSSQGGFRGYHTAYAGPGGTVRYAVIAYPRGTVNNSSVSFLADIDSITKTASHEIAEAATDPDIGYSTKGWYDNNLNGEIGDINNDQVIWLNGYAMQRVIEPNDQNMTPANARSDRQVNFVLLNNGDLWEHGSGGWTYLSANITSISDQSIDLQGHAMIDAIVSGGYAWEYHDQVGWTFLTSTVVSAKSGQGESFLLLSNGAMWEYKDVGSWWHLDDNVTAIDAGTDRFGVNSVVEIYAGGSAWEWSDSTGWHLIAVNVQSISTGQQGIVDFVTTGGDAYWWNEASGQTVYLASGVVQAATGVDQYGNYMIDLVYANGDNWEYRAGSGWSYVDYNVRSISKAVGGMCVHTSNADNAWLFDNNDNYTLLTSDALMAT